MIYLQGFHQYVRTIPPSNSKSPPIRYLEKREKPKINKLATSTGAIISLMRDLPIITSFTTNTPLVCLIVNLVQCQRCFDKTGADGEGSDFSFPFGRYGLTQSL